MEDNSKKNVANIYSKLKPDIKKRSKNVFNSKAGPSKHSPRPGPEDSVDV